MLMLSRSSFTAFVSVSVTDIVRGGVSVDPSSLGLFQKLPPVILLLCPWYLLVAIFFLEVNENLFNSTLNCLRNSLDCSVCEPAPEVALHISWLDSTIVTSLQAAPHSSQSTETWPRISKKALFPPCSHIQYPESHHCCCFPVLDPLPGSSEFIF